MTSFAAYAPNMPSHDFDLFNTSTDQYAEMMATSQAFGMPNSFFDSPFGGIMSTLDSSASLHAPAQVPHAADDYAPSTQAMQMRQHYSPTASSPPPHQHFGASHVPRASNASGSATSAQSSSSSGLGSPTSNGAARQQQQQSQPQSQYQEQWSLGMSQSIMPQGPFVNSNLEQDLDRQPGFVDPSLISAFSSPALYSNAPFGTLAPTASPAQAFVEPPLSPTASGGSSRSNTFNDSRRFKTSGSQSPYLHTYGHQPYQHPQLQHRRSSQGSIHSGHSHSSHHSGSFELDDESVQRGLCPIPECGRVFKDLKAHMLTHQNERPEKCPIVTCEYHVKGFARKYDKNRHTLTHYKGTMVCGFCPGSGSAAEKSFNRADVFKRHLTSVHGVEQTPPNSRKKSPVGGAKKNLGPTDSKSGTCSTCGVLFSNVQDFYEHLDDCVMRVVQQTDSCEAINQKNLGSVQDDSRVQETLDKHSLPGAMDLGAPDSYDEADEDSSDEADARESWGDARSMHKNSKDGS